MEGTLGLVPENQPSVPITESIAPEQTPIGQSVPVQPELTVSEKLRQIFDDANNEGTTGTQEKQIEEVQPQPLETTAPEIIPEFIPGTTFKSTEELTKGYQNARLELTKKSQVTSEVQKASELLKAENAELLQKYNELSAKQQQPLVTEEEPIPELDTEAFMEQFYENPQAMIAKLVEEGVRKSIAPLESRIGPIAERATTQQKQEIWDDSTKAFFEATPDMAEFADGMKDYIRENNLYESDNPSKVLNDAYIHSRGMKYEKPQTIDPKSYLSDEKFVNENIRTNPAIKEMILKDHMAQVRGNQQNIPPVITGNSAGNSVTIPQAKATSIADAVKMAADRLFGAR